MTEPTSEIVELARSIREDLAVRFPPRFAKLYSEHTRLREGQEGLVGWRRSEASERLSDAMRLLEAAFVEREAGSDAWTDGVRRVGELLEWLSHPQLNPNKLPIRFLAAAAYQFAGYPARASGLLTEDSLRDEESNIIRFLLRADFPRLLRSLTEYWATGILPPIQEERDLTWDDTKGFSDSLARLIVEETVRVLGILCAEMRWGGEHRVEKALSKFSAIAKVSLHGDDPYSWLLAKLCAEVTSVYIRSSFRHYVEQISRGMSSDGQNAIERYLRQRYQFCRILAWPSQIRGIERLSSDESFALCTPTGSGKTAVAELAILQSLFPRPSSPPESISHSDPLQFLRQFFDEGTYASIVMYLVPSRALAAEVESKLSSVLCTPEGGITVTGLYGGTDWGPTDAWVTREERTILICTYEKAEALMRFLGIKFLHRIALIIIDEAHSVQFDGNISALQKSENRAFRLESLATRLFAHLEPSRVIALSAVASGCEDKIASWVAGRDDASPIQTSYRSTRQLIGRLECLQSRRCEIIYDLLDGSSLQFQEPNQRDRSYPYIPRPFPSHPPAPNFEKTGPEKRLRPYLFWGAMHLAKPDEKGKQHSVLISITQNIVGYARDFLNLLESTWSDQELPEFFRPTTDPKKQELWEKCKQSCADYFGTGSVEYRLLKRGVIVHYGSMPGLTARTLVEVIQQRIVYLVMATSTLSEGVNLPFETILIPSLRRWPGHISAREFANLVGRAGRPGFGTEGRSLGLLQPAQEPSYKLNMSIRKTRNIYFTLIEELVRENYVSGEDELSTSPLIELLTLLAQQHKTLTGGEFWSDLNGWLEQAVPSELETEGHLDISETLDSLDGLLISAIVEIEQIADRELSLDELEDQLKRIWGRTYAHFASFRESALEGSFIKRGLAIKSSIYPDPPRRRRLYRTSLPPCSGSQLLEHYPNVREHLEVGTEYAEWENRERFNYIRILAEKIRVLKRFELSESLGRGRNTVSWLEVLHWWLDSKGSSMKPDPEKVSDWHKFVRQNFVYRFNWALGSIISLAIDDAQGDDLLVPNIEDWPQTDLPWIVFWLKELIVWGTLEPVAAYLLGRRIEYTREDAERTAQAYYEEQAQTGNSDELLNAMTIRNWVNSLSAHRHGVSSGPKPPSEIAVELLRDFANVQKQEWRVMPVEVNDEIQWFDPAGFPLASCQKPEDWQSGYLDSYDFVLDASKKIVRSEFYA